MRKATALFLIPVFFLLAFPMHVTAGADGACVPEWADVMLNPRGFLDEGVYVLEDPENGHWMYVNSTLRVEIVRTREKPGKIRERDYIQDFNCYTAEIRCDTEKGELPLTLWADPEHPGYTAVRKSVAAIAAEQHAVFAVSTDLFTARNGIKTGVIIRNGVIICDTAPRHAAGGRPSFDTLALYRDGHADSFLPAEKRAGEYIAEDAVQVYTFGPVLLRNGVIPEEIPKYNDRNLNPMHAFGTVEPGHYIDVICEGRLKDVNGSTGVMAETLAGIMRERGCTFAVCLDGGDTAVMAFMGEQLNTAPKVSSGRVTCEVLAFGIHKAEKGEYDP